MADPLPTRRTVLKSLGIAALGAVGFGGYAFAWEPGFRLVTTRYFPAPENWPADFPLTIAVIADVHAAPPVMPLARIRSIVAEVNALGPDVVVLLGDYIGGYRFATGEVPDAEWSAALGELSAPLGVHAILGNHDWWDDRAAQARKGGPVAAGEALRARGIPVYENRAVRIEKDGRAFWLAGLADQWALIERPGIFRGLDDLPATLAQVTDDAPIVLLAHEPDIFPQVPDRVALTLSGHTHGGQVRLFGWSPWVPSDYGNRYAYGHIVERRRHLIVSGGLGCSILPVRFGVPPEIVLVTLGRPDLSRSSNISGSSPVSPSPFV
jgi:predicted MPP superfamily phosphohydrolase